jgi:hypothetical protein
MKKIIFLITFFTLFLIQILSAQSFEVQAKGANDKHFVAIKGDKIEGQNKFSYMFSNLSVYKFHLKHTKKQSYMIKILDENENEIATNYDDKKKRYTKNMIFKCPKTARYYVKLEAVD